MLEEYFNKYYDKEIVKKIVDGLGEKVTSIRINTLKTNKEEVISFLESNNIKYSSVDWYSDALIVDKDIVNTTLYEEGKIYLQSLSSMIPPLILDPKSNETILDMTAAPGSKTSEIAALANNNVLITATEKNKKRYERLKYNMDKLGVKKCNIIQIDARNLDSFYSFDKILLDAPCSGSGTITSINDFDEESLDRINIVQKELMDKAISLLNSGGILIYSTCSILDKENEEVIDYILSKYKDIKLVNIDKERFKDIDMLPSKYKEIVKVKPNKYYEGFFVSMLKKER